MADVKKLIAQKMAYINKVVEKACRDVLGDRVKKILVYNIQDSFYSLGYGDEHDLWNSITVNVYPVPTGFAIDVYFDADKINHTSWFGSNKLGIKAGENVFSISWINDGQTFMHGSRKIRMRDVGKAPRFIEKTIEDIKTDSSLVDDFNSYLRKNGIDVK